MNNRREIRFAHNELPPQVVDERTITGVAMRYNDVFDIDYEQHRMRIRENISPGAFDRSLDGEDEIFSYYMHDSSMVLGKRSSGTLEITNDRKELRYQVRLPDTSYANDALHLIQRGDVTGLSIGFIALDESMTETKTDDWTTMHRDITEARLLEVSIVHNPAYKRAQIERNGDSYNGAIDAYVQSYQKQQKRLLQQKIELLNRKYA